MKAQAMIKVGLVGEDPNDTSAIRNLLSQQFGDRVRFVPLVERRRGSQLDTIKFSRELQIDLRTKQPRIVLFIRDADGIATETEKLEKQQCWYQKHSRQMSQPHLFLLNVYELEALIFADIDTFNSIYGTSIRFGGDVTMKSDPKGELKRESKKQQNHYEESDAPVVFSKLNLHTVKNRCDYFKDFVVALNALVAKA